MTDHRHDGAPRRALPPCDPDRPEAAETFAPGWFDSSLDLRLGLQVIEWALPAEPPRLDAQSAA